MLWAEWREGAGPLVKTADDAWAFPYDHDGSCAFRVGDKGQVTSKPVADVMGRWAFYVLAADKDGAELWIDEGPVETWNAAPTKPQADHLVLGEDATGRAAHFAVFEKRLSHEELQKLWEVGKNDPELLK